MQMDYPEKQRHYIQSNILLRKQDFQVESYTFYNGMNKSEQ